ncbi:MAG: hypothetical protein ACI8QD_000213 [Cyclobacteriaceae bacterium]|jgi:hypothetical protein
MVPASAQDVYQMYGIYRNPFRVFVNHISWNVMAGYGQTQFNHNLEGFYLLNDAGNLYIVGENNYDPEAGEQVIQGYGGWFNDPTIGPLLTVDRTFELPREYIENPVNNPFLRSIVPILGEDIVVSGPATSVPVTVSANVEFKNIKIGGGYTFERQWIKSLTLTHNEGLILPDYVLNFSAVNFHRAFGMLGYRFYEFWDYAAVVDVQVGKLWYGDAFNVNALQGSINLNAGITLEHHWSEYFSVNVRPSFDYKRYQINLPVPGEFVLHQHNSFQFQVGISIKIPEIQRTPYAADHVQLKHVITDVQTGRLMEVRGQPFWKKQNPKVGENSRKLFRYKWRNKRKLHPY